MALLICTSETSQAHCSFKRTFLGWGFLHWNIFLTILLLFTFYLKSVYPEFIMKLFNYIAKLFIGFKAYFEVCKNYERAINSFPITYSLILIPLAWVKASSHLWSSPVASMEETHFGKKWIGINTKVN